MGLQHVLAHNAKAGLRRSINDKEFLPEIQPTKMFYPTETNVLRGDE